MSNDHEKNQIIKYFLSSFKNRELCLINFIVFYFKESIIGTTLSQRVRFDLQKNGDIGSLDKILEKFLNETNIDDLKKIKNGNFYINNMFLKIKELKDITKDKRLFNFIKLNNRYNQYYGYYQSYSWNLNFDLPEMELNDILNIHEIIMRNYSKEFILSQIKAKYSELINHKKNLKKYMNDDSFLYWAFNYLNKKTPYFLIGKPINNNDYKESINNYFDNLFLSNNLQYEKEIDAIKKAWQQKQFRDQGKTKKEYHLPLTKQAKKELSMLAMLKNISENSMLEELIHQAYLNEICDENGKSRY